MRHRASKKTASFKNSDWEDLDEERSSNDGGCPWRFWICIFFLVGTLVFQLSDERRTNQGGPLNEKSVLSDPESQTNKKTVIKIPTRVAYNKVNDFTTNHAPSIEPQNLPKVQDDTGHSFKQQNPSQGKRHKVSNRSYRTLPPNAGKLISSTVDDVKPIIITTTSPAKSTPTTTVRSNDRSSTSPIKTDPTKHEQLVRSYGNVKSLELSTFDSAILGVPHAIVNFYSMTCEFCKKFEHQYVTASEYFRPHQTILQFFRVDASMDTKLSSRYGVHELPVILHFEGKVEKPKTFTGAHDKNGLKSFVNEILENYKSNRTKNQTSTPIMITSPQSLVEKATIKKYETAAFNKSKESTNAGKEKGVMQIKTERNTIIPPKETNVSSAPAYDAGTKTSFIQNTSKPNASAGLVQFENTTTVIDSIIEQKIKLIVQNLTLEDERPSTNNQRNVSLLLRDLGNNHTYGAYINATSRYKNLEVYPNFSNVPPDSDNI